MKKNIKQQSVLNQSHKNLDYLIKSGASDIQIMKARLKEVLHDRELQKKVLIDSGVYDKNLKLTKHYR